MIGRSTLACRTRKQRFWNGCLTLASMDDIDHQQLREQIIGRFDLAELKVVAFDLGLRWDELVGATLSEKAIALITYMERRGRLLDLVDYLANASTSFVKNNDAPTFEYRQNLINNIRHAWIDGLLHHAIHHDIHLTLNKTYKRDAVSRFDNLRLIPDDEPISPETDILDIFEKSGRSLLILGAPASGKTITLLKLAEVLLDRAQKYSLSPIPIILNLSSWGSQQLPLAEWIVDELFIQQQTARPLSHEWLKGNQFTLLLDGLDEVVESAREACVAAINDFKAEHPANLVVCSRLDDYQTLAAQLNLPTAICLQPLTPRQIDDYLTQFGANLETLRHSLTQDRDLQELAQSPLMLSLMALAYDQDTLYPATTASTENKRQHLFATYSQRVFDHRPLSKDVPYNQNLAKQWLTNLAHGLEQHNQSIFYIERLQLTWLPERRLHLWFYRLLAVLGSGMLLGMLLGLILGLPLAFLFTLLFLFLEISQGSGNFVVGAFFWEILSLGLVSGLSLGSSLGLIGGLFSALREKWFFEQLRKFSLLTRPRRKILANWLIYGLSCGFLIGLFGVLGGGLLQIIRLGFGQGVINIQNSSEGFYVTAIASSNLGDVSSSNGLLLGLLLSLCFGLTGGLFSGLSGGLLGGLLDSLLRGRITQLIARTISRVYSYLLRRQNRRIEIIEDVAWHWPKVASWWQETKIGTLEGLSFGLAGGILIGILIGFSSGIAASLIFSLSFGLINGLMRGLKSFVQLKQFANPLQPNQGIKATRRTILRAGLPFAFIGAIIGISIGVLIDVIAFNSGGYLVQVSLVVLGIFYGLLNFGGITLWRHYLLRIRLTRQGILPFYASDHQLVTYFDDMVEHLLLRRVGGGWVFIHRYLQEYFAAQHPQVGQPLPDPLVIPKFEP